jgi:hypothetical protein
MCSLPTLPPRVRTAFRVTLRVRREGLRESRERTLVSLQIHLLGLQALVLPHCNPYSLSMTRWP